MSSRFAACTSPDLLSVAERSRYEALAAQAGHQAREAKARLALDARARQQLVAAATARTLEDAPCGCRSRAATATERQALVAHVAPEREFAPVRPYWETATPQAGPLAAMAANAVPPVVAALTPIAGESYADQFRRIFEAVHPGERAFVGE